MWIRPTSEGKILTAEQWQEQEYVILNFLFKFPSKSHNFFSAVLIVLNVICCP